MYVRYRHIYAMLSVYLQEPSVEPEVVELATEPTVEIVSLEPSNGNKEKEKKVVNIGSFTHNEQADTTILEERPDDIPESLWILLHTIKEDLTVEIKAPDSKVSALIRLNGELEENVTSLEQRVELLRRSTDQN